MLAKISGLVYLAVAGMSYAIWRLWQGKELIGTSDDDPSVPLRRE